MLAVHTPAPHEWNKPIRNELIEDLMRQHCYEIVRWPAYLSDDECMNRLRRNADPNVILYIALMKGITPITTIGQYKSFIASFDEWKKGKKDRKGLPKMLSNKELKELEERAKKRYSSNPS